MSEPTIECGPCVLRPWRHADIDALVRHADNANVSRGLRDVFPFPYTRADGESWLALTLDAPRDDWRFAIEVEGEAAGGLGIHPGHDVHRGGSEIGYWLGEAHWGRGIMSAALAVVTSVAFERFAIERIQSGVYGNNPASMRVLEKAGFVREGVQRRAILKRGEVLDLVMYARLRHEP